MNDENSTFRIGSFLLDSRSRELRRDGRVARLQEKPFVVLSALLGRPGQVVTREELQEKLWPEGTVVDFENNLNSAVASLRSSFGDAARSPCYIETLPRIGYRLIAPVRACTVPERPPRARWVRSALGAGTLATMFVVVVLAASARRDGNVDRPTPNRSASLGGDALSPAEPAARRAFHQALYLRERGSLEDLERSLVLLDDVAARAPGFARAHAARARVLAELGFRGRMDLATALRGADTAARAALDLKEDDAEAHRVLTQVLLHKDWDFTGAAQHLESSLAAEPRISPTWLTAASLVAALGRYDSAILAARRAVELDPASYLIRSDLAFFYLAASRYEEAARAAEETLELEPDFGPALRFLVLARERLGQIRHASKTAHRIMRLGGCSEAELLKMSRDSPIDSLERYRSWDLSRTTAWADSGKGSLTLAKRHAAVGRRHEALDFLEIALREKDPFLVFLDSYRNFDSLVGDPRFEAVAAALRERRPSEEAISSIVTSLRDRSW